MALNGVTIGKVMLKNLLDDTTIQANVLVCNTMAEVLIALAPHISANVFDNGKIILSGILTTRLDAVKKAYLDAGFTFIEEKIKGEWSALVVGKNK
jgi:ribosomal protein L11 methyltransferase